MRVICSIAALMLLTGCQNGTGGSNPSPTPARPQANGSTQTQTKPAAQTNQSTPTAQAKPGWTPSWWIAKPTRTAAGSVQASGTATAGELLEARRQAIESARTSALTLADAGARERVIQTATNPNANGSYTVWVVLELGGQ